MSFSFKPSKYPQVRVFEFSENLPDFPAEMNQFTNDVDALKHGFYVAEKLLSDPAVRMVQTGKPKGPVAIIAILKDEFAWDQTVPRPQIRGIPVGKEKTREERALDMLNKDFGKGETKIALYENPLKAKQPTLEEIEYYKDTADIDIFKTLKVHKGSLKIAFDNQGLKIKMAGPCATTCVPDGDQRNTQSHLKAAFKLKWPSLPIRFEA